MAQTQDAILLREAVTAAKGGNKVEARQLLRQASVHNANNELVWLWRASLSESPKEAIFYLGEVLRINPQNQKALAWLEKCKGVTPPTSEPKAAAPAQAPIEPAATQTLTNIPVPGSVAGVAAGRPAPAVTHGLARAAEQVGTSTVRPEGAAVSSAYAYSSAGSNGSAAGLSAGPGTGPVRISDPGLPLAKPPEPAQRPRPTVIPFAPSSSKGATAPAVQPQVAYRWRCPFCTHGSDTALRRCPMCRAITVLDDLKEIEKNDGVQERVVREALGRMEMTPADKRTFEQNCMLGLGHLNLREATSALPFLKAASQQKKGDWALLGILDQLQWRKVILVVDDSLTIRKALSSILEKNDYRVVTAEDGSHALNRLNEAVPDLVLLDITMPWMDGYEVCKNIKAKALTRKVPVIMLSGKDGLFDKVRGKLAGCNDYVTKPFDPDSLLKTIKKYVS